MTGRANTETEPLASTKEWRALAKIDPMFVVAAWPGKRGSWTAEEFYALGHSDSADAIEHWRRYWPELGGVCLEVGCGAGRMTVGLADVFDEVIGVDVSEEMLELARKAVSAARFLIVAGTTLPLEDASVDAIFTTHVLQHLDGIDHVRAYLAEMHRTLRPGGSAMIHMLLGPPRTQLRQFASQAKLRVSRIALERGREWLHYHGEAYPAPLLRATLLEVGFADVELCEFAMRSNGDPHPFWLVRRI